MSAPAETIEAWVRRVGWVDDLIYLALRRIEACHSDTCPRGAVVAYCWNDWCYTCPERCLVIFSPREVLDELAWQLGLFESEIKNLAQVYRLRKPEQLRLGNVNARWNIHHNGLYFIACYTSGVDNTEFGLVWGQGRSIWYEDAKLFQLFKQTFVQ
jgi:hypothetical protein